MKSKVSRTNKRPQMMDWRKTTWDKASSSTWGWGSGLLTEAGQMDEGRVPGNWGNKRQ